MPKAPDPTKDPEFQNVVRHFLKTPPQPFTPKAKGDGKASPKPPKARIKR
jgi:hypothetical protein